MSHQVCNCCGWSKVTTYQGLRTHQGKKGCTPRGMRIPESEQFRTHSYIPQFTYVGPPIRVEEPLLDILFPSIKPDSERNMWNSLWEEPSQKDSTAINSTPVRKEPPLMSVPQTLSGQANPSVTETNKSLFETPQHFQQNATKVCRALDFSTDAQQPPLMSVPQILSGQANPAVTETNKSLFETPQHSQQNATKVCRLLDFSTGAQQVEPLIWDPPTTTALETAVRPKEKVKKEREDEKLLKARQDRIRADFQQKIQMRELKMAEVRSSVKACKGSLDTEWLEINSVFSEVMRVVEDARQKALQPLEKRRRRVKTEGQDLVQALQKEIDKLKNCVDELDKNQDSQVTPLTGVDESHDWKSVTVDTSFSFSTLRGKTSSMVEQIHQKMEKLTSLELKRIPTFAVDVKLDQNTAHPCLLLSRDGKKVKDGGENRTVPDAPERFDRFGSILGLNRLTSGKSYWEVEVGNKTGWDLGVARHDANRKGKLSLTPENGYWVTVHYEEKNYAALSAPPVSLSLTVKPQKVGVFVDCEEGLVSFYDVTAQTHIYSFTECSFSDEIFPYFSPHLNRNGKNSDPLIISDVKKQE